MFNFILKLNKIIFFFLFLYPCLIFSNSYNLDKKILNRTNNSIPVGTIIAWPLQNVNPDPKLWTECGQKKANPLNANINYRFSLNKYLKPFSTKSFLSDMLITTEGTQLLNLTYDDYINSGQFKESVNENIIPLQNFSIDLKINGTSFYKIVPNNNSNSVLSVKNNIYNHNFENLHIYNNRSPIYLEPNMFEYGREKINILMDTLNNWPLDNQTSSFPVYADIVEHEFYGYSGQRYLHFIRNADNTWKSNNLYNLTDHVYDHGYDTSNVDFWGTPFDKSEQFVKQEKVFDNTKLTTYFLPMYTSSYVPHNVYNIFKYGTKPTKKQTENHPDHIIVRYFCRTDPD